GLLGGAAQEKIDVREIFGLVRFYTDDYLPVVFFKARRSLRLWASSARELPQAVYRIPTSPFWILLESIEFQPIGLPSVPQSAWSAVSARYSGRSTCQSNV